MDFKGELEVIYLRNTYSISSSYKLSEDGITSAATLVCPHRTVTYEMSGTLNDKMATCEAELQWATDKKVSLFTFVYGGSMIVLNPIAV